MLIRRILFFLLWINSGLVFAQSVEIVTLHHRSAKEMITVIEPFLEQAIVKAHGSQLIIKADKKEVAMLRDLIAQLDIQRVELEVIVHRGHLTENEKTIRAGSIRENIKKQFIRVTEGEIAKIENNKIIKWNKVVTGQQETLTKHSSLVKDEDRKDQADLAEKIQLSFIDISEYKEDIIKKEQAIAEAKILDNTVAVPTLETELETLKTNLQAEERNYQGLIAKQQNYEVTIGEHSEEDLQIASQSGGVLREKESLPQGIYVRPTLLGSEKVELNIILVQSDNKIGGEQQQIGHLETTIRGFLDQWINISGSGNTDELQKSIHTSSRAAKSDQIWVKVKKITNQ